MIEYKYEDDSFFKENKILRICSDEFNEKNQDDMENLIILYKYLSNPESEKNIISLLSEINEIIFKSHFSFSTGFPIQEILEIVFDLCNNPEEKIILNSFETIFLILRNSYYDNDENYGQYFYQNNFHQILHSIYTFNQDEYHTKKFLDAIALYSSSCIEARDSILSLFQLDFFEQFIQARSIECIKYAINCFTEFLKYPLDLPFLSSLYNFLSEMTEIEDDEILYQILSCIIQSMKQKSWENLFIDYKLHHFVKESIKKNDQNMKELGIVILYGFSVDFSLEESILETIINEFLNENEEEETKRSQNFSIFAAKIFTNHMKRNYLREILLKQGMIAVLQNFFVNGTYSIKVASAQTIIELIKYGYANQKVLFLEYNLMGDFLEIIQSDETNMTIDILNTLLSVFDAACEIGYEKISLFIDDLNECKGLDCLNDLVMSENEEIKSRAQCLLSNISKNQCFN